MNPEFHHTVNNLLVAGKVALVDARLGSHQQSEMAGKPVENAGQRRSQRHGPQTWDDPSFGESPASLITRWAGFAIKRDPGPWTGRHPFPVVKNAGRKELDPHGN
jgi:hypothetical protein